MFKGMGMVAALLGTLDIRLPAIVDFPQYNRGAPKRRNKTTRHPHSSTRQRARYARQIAAGQLRMAGVADV